MHSDATVLVNLVMVEHTQLSEVAGRCADAYLLFVCLEPCKPRRCSDTFAVCVLLVIPGCRGLRARLPC